MAWGNSAATNCTPIRNYKEADRHFNNTRKPRTKRWGEHQRPLYETRHTHFRLEKGSDDLGPFYGVWLYRMELARFYEPKEDGTHMVCYNTYESNMTHAFMRHVLGMSGWRPTFTTTDGRKVIVPLKPARGNKHNGNNEPWAATLWFDAHDKLMVDKSWHIPVALRRMNDDDKARRAAKRKDVETLLDMLTLRLSSMISPSNADFQPDLAYTAPFYDAMQAPYRKGSVVGAEDFLYKYHVEACKPVAEWSEAVFDAFFRMCQQLANAHVSVVACREGMDWERLAAGRSLVPNTAPPRAIQWVLDNPKEYLKTVDRRLMQVTRMDNKSGHALIPQFPEKLPTTVAFYYAPEELLESVQC